MFALSLGSIGIFFSSVNSESEHLTSEAFYYYNLDKYFLQLRNDKKHISKYFNFTLYALHIEYLKKVLNKVKLNFSMRFFYLTHLELFIMERRHDATADKIQDSQS